VTFTGSGQFAAALGEAKIKEVVLFTSPSTGKATWILKGHVVGINQARR
jgi:hypothetical protein